MKPINIIFPRSRFRGIARFLFFRKSISPKIFKKMLQNSSEIFFTYNHVYLHYHLTYNCQNIFLIFQGVPIRATTHRVIWNTAFSLFVIAIAVSCRLPAPEASNRSRPLTAGNCLSSGNGHNSLGFVQKKKKSLARCVRYCRELSSEHGQ